MSSPARSSASINNNPTSLLPLLAVGVIWYHLSARGVATQTVWLALNVLDTLRALRAVRPNGRRIGVNTRKKATRDTLACWIIYVVGQMVGPILSTILGWIPFYTPIKAVICAGFLFTRVSTSSHIYTQLLVPAIKPYETPIDLTILLFQSILILVFYYLLELPIKVTWTTLKAGWSGVSSLLLQHTTSTPRVVEIPSIATPESRVSAQLISTPPRVITSTDLGEDHLRYLASPGPVIPGSILLRHPTPKPARPTLKGRRSIVFISPPATPKVSPPSSPESVIVLDSLLPNPHAQVGPSTPRRPISVSVPDVVDVDVQQRGNGNAMLAVPQAAVVRRSPRRRRQESDRLGQTTIDVEELDLMARRASAPELGTKGGTERLVRKSNFDAETGTAITTVTNANGGPRDEDNNPFIDIDVDTINQTEGIIKSRSNGSDDVQFLSAATTLSKRNAPARAKPVPTASRANPKTVERTSRAAEVLGATEPQPLADSSSSTKAIAIAASTQQSQPESQSALIPAKPVTAKTSSTSSKAALASASTIAHSNPRSAKIPSKKRSAPSSAAAAASTAKTASSTSKSPRKKRVLKASSDGVAHDKPLPTAASRSRSRVRIGRTSDPAPSTSGVRGTGTGIVVKGRKTTTNTKASFDVEAGEKRREAADEEVTMVGAQTEAEEHMKVGQKRGAAPSSSAVAASSRSGGGVAGAKDRPTKRARKA
ncbi:hypothetical protein IAT40_001097 [Kwoniella sp. CBS 6097]